MQKLLREPLFHFLILGGILFGLYAVLNHDNRRPQDNDISIADSDIERLVNAYRQSWNTEPDSTTLQQLIKEEIKSEIYYREALRMNLDHNDEIIRRRLRQKYEFLIRDLSDQRIASDVEVEEYYQKQRDQYMSPKKISFHQLYLNPDSRQDPEKDANGLLATILSRNPESIKFKDFGDVFHLQEFYAERDLQDIGQLFGQEFSETLFENNDIGWIAPLASGYGWHLVFLTSVVPEQLIPLESIRDQVEEDIRIYQMANFNELQYQNLKEQYDIEYELSKWENASK